MKNTSREKNKCPYLLGLSSRSLFLKSAKCCTVLIVLASTMVFSVWPQRVDTPKAEAAWYNNSPHWKYRQKFTITNSGSELTDYQFLFSEQMMGRWKFDEASNSTLSDSSGNNNTGTITGLGSGVSWTPSGNYNYALSFDGVGSSFADMGSATSLAPGSNALTLTAWIHTDSTNQMRIISKGSYNYSKGYMLGFDNGNITAGIGSGSESTSLQFSTTGTLFNDASWHSIAAVFDPDTNLARIYVDGSAKNLSKTPGTCGTVTSSRIDFSDCSNDISAASSNDLFVGRNDTNSDFPLTGVLDEVRVYNRAFTSSDVTYLRANDVSPLLRGDIYSFAQEDGDDLRFTTSDGTTDIPYFKEQFTAAGQNAKYWLKIPLLAANTTTNIYVYFGNADASSASNGDNTFLFYDDFNGSGLDSGKWPASSISAVASGVLSLNDSTDNQTADDYVYADNYNVPIDTVVELRHKSMATDTYADRFGLADQHTTFHENGINYIGSQHSTDGFTYYDINGGGTLSQTAGSSFNTAWHTYGFIWTSSNVKYLDNEVAAFSYSDNIPLATASLHPYLRDRSQTDWIRIRKYVAMVPLAAVSGSIETYDASLTFTVEGVPSGQIHNGITTTVSTTFNTVPFGQVKMNESNFGAQKVTVQMNAMEGYTVTVKLDGYIQGLNPANKIDPFGAQNVSWSTPQLWSSPNGTELNTDSGWFGANTSDTRVSGWSSAAAKFGPISSTAHTIMAGSDMESSASAYVTYGLEVNAFQPSDNYAGTLIYSVVPQY